MLALLAFLGSVSLAAVEQQPDDSDSLLRKTGEITLKEGRQLASATVMAGRVYIFGGVTGQTVRADMEIVDLRSGTSELVSLPTPPRFLHSAAAYEGKIYFFGGLVPGEAINPYRHFTDHRLLLGVVETHFTAASPQAIVAFDLKTKAVTRESAMTSPRYSMGAVLIGSKVHLLGGSEKKDRTAIDSSSHEIFDLATRTWTQAAPLLASQACQGVALDRLILLAGGGRIGRPSKAVLAYDTQVDGWRMLGPLPYPVAGHSVARLGRYLFLFGDYDRPTSIIAYDLTTQTSMNVMLKCKPMLHSSAVVHDEKIYVIGGITGPGEEESRIVQVFALNPNYPPE